MRITKRLWMAIGTLMMMLVVGVVGLFLWLQTLQRQVDRITTVSARVNEAAHEMEINVNSMGVAVSNYLHAADPLQHQKFSARAADFQEYFAAYQRRISTLREKELAMQAGNLFGRYVALGNRLMGQKDRGVVDERVRAQFMELRAKLNELLDDGLQARAMNALTTRREQARDTMQNMLAAVVVLLVLGLAVAIPASTLLGRGIAATERTLAESEARKAKIVDAALDCIITFDAQGTIIGFNPAAERTFGYPRAAALRQDVAELLVPSRLRERFRQGLTEMLIATDETQDLHERLEITAVRVDGAEFPVDAAIARISTGGDPVFTAFLRDISDRKRAEEALIRANETLEERVRERTAEWEAANEALARSNAELEQFASVASHDLQEPLRKIQSFGERLEAKYAAALDERGRDYITRMRSAAGRMQRLINDLLAFSRVTTKARPFVPVDLEQVAHEVESDLEDRLQQTGGGVLIGSLPAIDADPLQMRQLLQNLIANGLKFHKPDEPPLVRVEGRMVESGSDHAPRAACSEVPAPALELSVCDNGIGFEQEYAERIFEVFQRLHGRLDYEGTGMGLAICRKIVERHGGTITAQSCPGRGASFIVTLPIRQPEMDQAANE